MVEGRGLRVVFSSADTAKYPDMDLSSTKKSVLFVFVSGAYLNVNTNNFSPWASGHCVVMYPLSRATSSYEKDRSKKKCMIYWYFLL